MHFSSKKAYQNTPVGFSVFAICVIIVTAMRHKQFARAKKGKPKVRMGRRVRVSIFGRAQVVAQVSNLLCRRLPAGNLSVMATPADWKSAIQQVGNLRYKNWDARRPGELA
jgi:hypothetical protein